MTMIIFISGCNYVPTAKAKAGHIIPLITISIIIYKVAPGRMHISMQQDMLKKAIIIRIY